MAQASSTVGSGFLAHVMGTLLLAGRRIVRAGLVAAAIGLVATEIVACVSTHHFPPSAQAQFVALALAGALAYGVGATVFVLELITGMVDTIRYLEGDVVAGIGAATMLAEHEAGHASNALVRLTHGGQASVPLPANTTPLTTPLSTPLASPLAAQPGERFARGTSQPWPAADSGPHTQPFDSLPPQLPPLPVRADRLPRIEWAREDGDPPTGPSNGTSNGRRSAGGGGADAMTPGAAAALAAATTAIVVGVADRTDPSARNGRQPAGGAAQVGPPLERAAPTRPNARTLGDFPRPAPPAASGYVTSAEEFDDTGDTHLIEPPSLQPLIPPTVVPTLTGPQPVVRPRQPQSATPHDTAATDTAGTDTAATDTAGTVVLVPPELTAPTRPLDRRTHPLTHPLDATTRPLPTVSGPLDVSPRGGSLWERLSQALIGQAPPETASEPGTDAAPSSQQEPRN